MPRAAWGPAVLLLLLLASPEPCRGTYYTWSGLIPDLNAFFTSWLGLKFFCSTGPCGTYTFLLKIPVGNATQRVASVGGALNLVYAQSKQDYSKEQYQPYLWEDSNGVPGKFLATGPPVNVSSSRWTMMPLYTSNHFVNGTVWAGFKYVRGSDGASMALMQDYTNPPPGSWIIFPGSNLGDNPAASRIGDPPFPVIVETVTWTPTTTFTPTLSQTSSVSLTGTRTRTSTMTPTRRRIIPRDPLSILDYDSTRVSLYGALPVFPDAMTAQQRAQIAAGITTANGEQFIYVDGTVTYFSPQDGRTWDVSWNSAGLTVVNAGSGVQRMVVACYDPQSFPDFLPSSYTTPLFLCLFDRSTSSGADANSVPLAVNFTVDPKTAAVAALTYANASGPYDAGNCSFSGTTAACSVPHTSMVALYDTSLASTPTSTPTSFPYVTLFALFAVIPIVALLGWLLYRYYQRPMIEEAVEAPPPPMVIPQALPDLSLYPMAPKYPRYPVAPPYAVEPAPPEEYVTVEYRTTGPAPWRDLAPRPNTPAGPEPLAYSFPALQHPSGRIAAALPPSAWASTVPYPDQYQSKPADTKTASDAGTRRGAGQLRVW